ncbi:MAG: RMD1 family protein [Legionellaceae bacterium]|nr:RMD1 family protein [Legionellaceae bacterium]
MECLSYCIANKVDLTRLDNHYKTECSDFIAVRSRDVLKITPINTNDILVFVFKNGTVVFWGVKRHQVNTYLNTIKLYADKPVAFRVRDEFIFSLGDKTTIEPHDYFEVDRLTIDIDLDNEDLRLSLSYGFSQSVKLQYFETILEALIDKYTPIIHNLSHKGEIVVSRNEIRKIVGEILGAKSEMNLISNFLYHPKYFWQHPTLEEHYIMLERYLHIQRRVNAINHRLDTLNEIFDMLNSYLENRQSHNLEIIIIILISLEIVFAILNFHF